MPIVFVHEYAGDLRSWEPQVRFFSRHYRCIAFNARGYPPSEIPQEPEQYGPDAAVADVAAVLDDLAIDSAYIVGLSMGAYTALRFALRYPRRALGLVFTSGGSGSPARDHERFARDAIDAADLLTEKGMAPLVEALSYGSTRVQLLNKDPRSWLEFRQQLSEHSALGSAHTMRNYQAKRPSLFQSEEALRAMRVPTLIVAGDEDDPVLETSLYLKRTIPVSGLWILPKTGHAVNLEEPGSFNTMLLEFFSAVDRKRWGPRDERARPDRAVFLPAQDGHQ